MYHYLEKRTCFHCINILDYLKAICGSIMGFSVQQNLFPSSHIVLRGFGSQRVKEGLKGFEDYFRVTRGNPVILQNIAGKVMVVLLRMVIFCLVVGLRVCLCAHKAVCVVFVWSLTFVAVTLVMWERTVASHASATTMRTVLVQTNSISVWNVTTTPRLEPFHCGSLRRVSFTSERLIQTEIL